MKTGNEEVTVMAIERWRPFGTTERWHPLRQFSDLQGEVNRLFDSVFGPPATLSTGERIWAPLCDMWETKDEVVVAFEVPGMTEKDINVSITGDMLNVKGERRYQNEQKEESYHRLERAYGKFERTVQLPVAVQPDKVRATYREGLLTITLPKAEEVKSKEIKVEIL
jgi:HSP20 family protein